MRLATGPAPGCMAHGTGAKRRTRGEDLIDEVAKVEAAEASIDAFIERRAHDMSSANAEAALDRAQAESRRRRYREAVLRQRLEFHEEQLVRHTRTFERLLDRHRSGLRLCEEALGLPISEQTKGDAA